MHPKIGHKFISDDVVGALLSDPRERRDEPLGGLGRRRVVDAVPVRKSTSESGGKGIGTATLSSRCGANAS